MTSKEFINTAVLAGYSNRKKAEKYCNNSDKTEFDTADFVELYRRGGDRYAYDCHNHHEISASDAGGSCGDSWAFSRKTKR